MIENFKMQKYIFWLYDFFRSLIIDLPYIVILLYYEYLTDARASTNEKSISHKSMLLHQAFGANHVMLELAKPNIGVNLLMAYTHFMSFEDNTFLYNVVEQNVNA